MILDLKIREKSFGNKSLMSDVTFSIDDSEKVGLIGRNGLGKSTLLNMIAGDDKDFSGEVNLRPGKIVVKTAQEHANMGDVNLLDYILGGLPEFALRGWCKRGEIQHLKSGSRVYLLPGAVEAFLERGAARP